MENYPYNPSYPESGNSSPRSREIDFENLPPWEDQANQQPPQNYKLKLMCSYGGKVHPRPHDNQLSYVGGETKILTVDRTAKFASLFAKLVALCDSDAISFKYQLPGEDLDALISVSNDEDLENMMLEYDRLYRISPKPARLRIFVFPTLPANSSFASDEVKTEKAKFLDALNSAPQQSPIPAAAAHLHPHPHPPPPSNVDFMLGPEKSNVVSAPGRIQEHRDPIVVPTGLDERSIGSDPIQKHILDLQRMRIDEHQQGIYKGRTDDILSGGGGEHYRLPDKTSQPGVAAGGVPYWAEKQIPGGVFPASGNEQPVYMIPGPQTNAYHAQMVRPVSAPPNQGYYAVQRMPSPEVYRDHHHQQQQQQQQQPMYNMFPQGGLPSATAAPPPQKVAGYSEGFGIVRTASGAGVGMSPEGVYPQVAYDSGSGRQVVYSAPIPGQGQAAQYQALAAAMSGDMRSAAEAAGGKASMG